MATWHYSGNPSATQRDAVRWHLGDVNEDEKLVYDEEIAYALSAERDLNGAIALCAEAIEAMLRREADVKVGGLSVSLSDKADHFAALAKKYRSRSLIYATPSVGGISIDEKDEQREDDDRVRPAFRRGMFRPSGVNVESRLAPDWTVGT